MGVRVGVGVGILGRVGVGVGLRVGVEVGADVGPAGTDGAALGGCMNDRMHHLVFNKTPKKGSIQNKTGKVRFDESP